MKPTKQKLQTPLDQIKNSNHIPNITYNKQIIKIKNLFMGRWKKTWRRWMACWKVGIEAFWWVCEVGSETWVSAEVAMAAVVKRRRIGGRWRWKMGVGLKEKRRERWGLWGLRIEVTNDKDRIAMRPNSNLFFLFFGREGEWISDSISKLLNLDNIYRNKLFQNNIFLHFSVNVFPRNRWNFYPFRLIFFYFCVYKEFFFQIENIR